MRAVRTKHISTRSTMTFKADGTGIIETAEFKVELANGKKVEIPAEKSNFTFEILGESKHQIVVKGKDLDIKGEPAVKKLLESHPFSIYVFENEDKFWFYVANKFTDLNVRYYFKRVDDKL